MRISTRRSDLPEGKSLISKVRYLGLFVPVLLLLVSYQTTYAQLNLDVSVYSDYNGEDISCFGGDNGKARALPLNGASPYTYTWSSGQTSQIATGLQSGTYTVTVTDDNSQSATGTVTLSDPPDFDGSASVLVPISCNGMCDGAVTVNIDPSNPGVSPYDFLWGSGTTTQTITDTCPGYYSVIVVDANGCEINPNPFVYLTEPSEIQVGAFPNNVSCNGGNNGSISLIMTGGVSPYYYSWSNLATTKDISNLTAGTYDVTIDDTDGCTETASFTITEPAVIGITVESTQDVLCFGIDNGEADISVTGGVTPYSYAWSTGANTQDVTGLSAGTHSVTVTDGNNCQQTSNITINAATQLIVNVSSQDVTCNGAGDGYIHLSVSGGLTPYNYTWSTGATIEDLDNLSGGTFTYTVSDANNCQDVQTIVIDEASQLVAGIVKTDVLCNGDATGVADLTVTGGVTPYSYAWNNGANTEDLNGVVANPYQVVVTDGNTCQVTANTFITEPAQLIANASSTDLNCYNDNSGAVSLVVTGGVTPYTYVWSNGSTEGNLNGVAAGTYDVTVKDANNCLDYASAIVDQPGELTASIAATDVDCNGNMNGVANLTVNGGTTPYLYSWSNSETTEDLNGLSGGTYDVTIEDDHGCLAYDGVTIIEPTALTLGHTQVDVLCNGDASGSIDLSISGGTTGYSVAWSNSESTEDISGLLAGTYGVTVSDGASCQATLGTIITQPAVLSANASAIDLECYNDNSGAVSLVVTGGITPYTYVWSNGSTEGNLNGVAAGTYDVTVKDANNCLDYASAVVNQPGELTASVVGTDVDCNGNLNGVANLTVNGGTAPYLYSWSNSETTEDLNGLAGGTYDVTVEDDHGCLAYGGTTINEPMALSLSLTQVDVLCNGDATGSINLTVEYGTSPYTIAWSNGEATEDISGLVSGAYAVTVTDQNNCQQTLGAFITQPAVLSANASAIDLECYNDNSGAVSLVVNGGTTPYTYSWSNGSDQGNLNGVAAGTYDVTVTDVNGCSDLASAVVAQPDELTASISGGDVSCYGAGNGVADLDVDGGTTPYLYSWSNGETTQDLSGLSGGTYDVTVEDDHGCLEYASVTIIESPALNLSHTQVNILCNGDATGSINLTVSDGTSPYTIVWSNGAGTEDISGLTAGSYGVTVTDANSCVQTLGTIITQPAVLSANASAIDLECYNDNSGAVSLVVNGGTTPYFYNWSNGSQAGNLNNLAAGTYDVTVTDSNGCSDLASATVSQPDELTASVVGTDVDCNGNMNGAANLTVDGGTTPYLYSWTNSETTEDLTGLSGGTYDVTVEDDHGCFAYAGTTINEPMELSLSLTQVDVLCNGDATGSINLTVEHGTSPYTIVWSNGAGTEDISGLTAGSYGVTVTDANSCVKTLGTIITQPAVLSANASAIDLECYNDNSGAVSLVVNGGTTPYFYNWSNGSQAGNLNNLAAGTYDVTVTDSNGCSDLASATVSQPDELTASVVGTDVDCNGNMNGAANLTVDGGTTPYLYSWTNSETTEDLTGLSGGTYDVTVEDDHGCFAYAGTTINEPMELSLSLTQVDVLCNGDATGSINLTVEHGTSPYTIVWSNGAGTEDISGLTAGSYGVTVTDANSCVKTLGTIITQPAVLSANASAIDLECYNDNSGAVSLVVNGGATPYFYNWSNGSQAGNLNNVAAGTYDVTVTDSNGCTDQATATVSQPDELTASVVGTDVDCNGNMNGAANLTVDGGTTPYLYSWSNSETTEDLTGLSGGTYDVTVEDDHGCFAYAGTTINEPTAITLSLYSPSCNGYHISKNGESDGSISASAGGGTGTLNFSWSNGATTQNLTGVAAGTYTVTVTDDNNCFKVESITLLQPPLLQVTLNTKTDVGCYGQATGAIDINVFGGVPTVPTPGISTYSFVWSNGATVEDPTGLIAGSYDVTVSDACGGQTVFGSISITQPILPLTGAIQETDILCYDDDDGSVWALASGGTAPYTYEWYKQSDMNNLLFSEFNPVGGSTYDDNGNGLSPDNYCVVITDGNGCYITKCALIDAVPQIVVTLVDSSNYNGYDVSCFGAQDGELDIEVSGGTPALTGAPYTYAWGNNYATTQDVTGLWAGAWGVKVTDDNGCEYVWQKTLTSPPEIVANVSETHYISCNGDNDGAAEVIITGGVAGTTFTTNWSNGASTAAITGLSAGQYCVTVVDDITGCNSNDAGVAVAFPSDWTLLANTMGDNHTVLFETANITIDGQGLQVGDYIGVFYNDPSTASGYGCAGYSEVTDVTGNTVVVVWGDDNTNTILDGMAVNEPLKYKLFRPYAGEFAVHSSTWNNSYDIPEFYKDRISVITSLTSNDVLPQSTLCLYLDEPDVLNTTAVVTDVDCYGNSNGEIVMTVTGGTTPYVITWSNGQSTVDLANLAPGTYDVTVEDDHGCLAYNSWTVEEPKYALWIDTDLQKHISCFNGIDGEIQITAQGGTSPYTYAWSNNETTDDISGLSIGTYDVTVTDANNCFETATYTLTQPDLLTISSVNQTNVNCYGDATGAIDITVSGGTQTWMFAWSNSTSMEDVSGLVAGSYTVTITDANSCIHTQTFTITEPAAELTLSAQVSDYNSYGVKCNGASDGTIDLTVTGGTTPLKSIVWSNGMNGTSISGLVAGVYTVTVTDANDCVETETITLTEPSAISFSHTQVNVDCNGNATGSIDLSVSGSLGTFTYSWSNGETTEDIANLSAGTYTVVATDANQCNDTYDVTITEPAVLTVTGVETHANCFGNATGAIDITVNGGTLQYNFAWSNGVTDEDQSDLLAGIYTVTVTDANGCIATGSWTITEPAQILVQTNVTDVDCYGNSTGEIATTVSGGSGTYTYMWSNGETTDQITGLPIGDYCVTVHDSNGCPTSMNGGSVPNWNFNLNSGSIHNILIPETVPTFAGVQVQVGDYLGVFYDSLGTEACGGYVIFNGATTSMPVMGDVTSPATPQVEGYGAGDSFVWKIWRQNVGEFSATATYVSSTNAGITAEGNFAANAISELASLTEDPAVQFIACATVIEPPLLTVSTSHDLIQCNGDATTFYAVESGGTVGYSFEWSNGISAAQMTAGAGTYTVTVTDGNNCTATASETAVDPAVLTISKTQYDVTCNSGDNGWASIAISGGYSPYDVAWSNNATETGVVTSTINNLTAGTYDVTVTDTQGCQETESFTITEPSALSVTTNMFATSCYMGNDGHAYATVNGGTSPYYYTWSNGGSSDNITSLTAGTYCVTVVDANGCPGTGMPSTSLPWNLVNSNTGTSHTIGIADGIAEFANGPLLVGDYLGVFYYDHNNVLQCGGYAEYTGGAMAIIAWGNDGTTPEIDGFEAGDSFIWKFWRVNAGEFDAVAVGDGTFDNSNVGLSAPTSITVDPGQSLISCVDVLDAPEILITGTLSSYVGGWNISCIGASDGAVTLTVTGGTGTYTDYAWSNGATTPGISGVQAGTYTVTVTDSNGCTNTQTFTLNEPEIVVAVAEITSIYTIGGVDYNTTCNTDNGAAQVTASGGTSPYTYVWSNGAGVTQSVSGLAAGTYNVTVYDANNCMTISNDITLTSPGPYNVTATQYEDILCYGDCSAAINVTWEGGVAPFDVYWSNWSGAPIIDTLTDSIAFPYCYCLPNDPLCDPVGFCAGTYWAVVVDANGCAVLTNQVTVTQPDEIVLAPGQTNVSCNGLSDGEVDLTLTTGGVSPYTFIWDASTNYATTDLLTGLSAGDSPYVMVWDANNCSFGEQFFITEPATLVMNSAVGTDVLCPGDANGTITVGGIGGTPAYEYYLNGVSYGFNNVITGLSGGTYVVEIKDANACVSNSMTVVINEPPALTVNLGSITDVTCNGLATGAIDINVGGGTSPYNYNWSNLTTLEDASGLAAGTYSVVVTDFNGCGVTLNNLVVNEPAVLTVGITSDVIVCNGDQTTFYATPNGGNGGESFLWSNTATGATMMDVAGTYDVLVTDAKGCTANNTITVADPALIVVTPAQTEVSCNGGADGTAAVSVTGGHGGFLYSWSTGDTGVDNVSGLAAGTYDVTISDAEGCSVVENFTITEPSVVSVVETIVDPLCHGDANGSISLAVSGGTPGYTYTWFDATQLDNVTGLADGMYDLTVADANGCTHTFNYTVTEPSQLAVNGVVSDVSCPGGSNGAINVTITGGTTPMFSTVWATGETTEDLTGIVAGNYQISVTDDNGCTAIAGFVVDEPAPLVVVDNITDVSCYGGNDGANTIDVSGGNGSPYVYVWSYPPGSTGVNSTSGLTAGNYNVVIYDGGNPNCTYVHNYTIGEPAAALDVTFAINNVNCNNGTDGSFTATATGGTSPYTYSWGASAVNDNLAAGDYPVTVSDYNGCDYSTTVTVTEPAALVASATVTPTDCSASTGVISVNASGGTQFASPALPYTIAWDHGATDFVLSGLPTGTYIYTVTDANGCSYSSSEIVTETNAIVLSASFIEPDCNGGTNGSIDLDVTGGNGQFTYAWSNSVTTEDNAGIAAGTYSVDVDDTNGCHASYSITVTEPQIVSADFLKLDETCYGLSNGQAEVYNFDGGDGNYTWEWSNGETTNSFVQDLAAGQYDVTVYDGKGCPWTQSFEIVAATEIQVALVPTDVQCNQDNNGAIDLQVTGGTGVGTYSYYWDNGETTEDLTGLEAGNYSVEIYDANGCMVTGSESVDVTIPWTIQTETVTPVSCNNGTNGSIYLEMSYGKFIFDVTDVLGNTVGSQVYDSEDILVDNLPSGEYTIMITHIIEPCTMYVHYNVTEPAALDLQAQVHDASCYKLNDGWIDLSVNGGTPSYNYEWTIGASVITTGIGTDGDLLDRKAGVYKVVVTDANGCSDFLVATIDQPTLMVNTVAVTDVTCTTYMNGEIAVTSNNGTAPYTYAWDGGATGPVYTGLAGGYYTVTVADANGCQEVIVDTYVHEPLQLTVGLVPTDLTCNGTDDGEVTATTQHGTYPYNFVWSTGDSSEDIENLSAGTYTLTVVDNNGCEVITSETVNEPDPVSISVWESNGLGNADAIGGNGGFTYTWSHSFVGSIVPLPSAPYSVTCTAEDVNGCFDTGVLTSPAPPAVANESTDTDNEMTFVNELVAQTVNIYPNPSTDGRFAVEFSNIDVDNAQMYVVDGFGKVVNTKLVVDPETRRVAISLNVAKGVYYLKIITDGDKVITKPLVITE